MQLGTLSELGFLALYSCPEQYGSSYVASVATAGHVNNAAAATGDVGTITHM